MPTAFVGETRLPKNFKRYARQFSLLELDCESGSVPGKVRLQACAEAAPPGFVFSLIVPSRLASLETGPDFDRSWKTAQNVAKILKAKWWVVRTPAEVRPTRRSRESLAALTARLKEHGMRVAWEPRGVWDETAAGDTADAIGAVLVQDIAREAPRPGSVLYARLLALGRGARVGLSLADLVVERLRPYEESFVVVEGQGAREIQQALGLAQDDAGLLDDDPVGGAAASAAGMPARKPPVDDGPPEDATDDLDEEDADDLDDDEGDDDDDDADEDDDDADEDEDDDDADEDDDDADERS
jgi:uncharacterized protein YecE (DUF72 family)